MNCVVDDELACFTQNSYQPYPKRGVLKRNLESEIPTILERAEVIDNNALVRAYILRTVLLENKRFVQRGSAPNWQGGMITLCTCMRQMRTYYSREKWESQNLWVAGFSSLKETPKGHFLIYLMKINQAFDSQWDIWNSNLPEETKKAKSALKHILGDIYEPTGPLGPDDIFNPTKYTGHKEHIHLNGYPSEIQKDIDYIGSQTKRRPSLLIGLPELSFIWTKPTYRLPITEIFREEKINLKEMLSMLIKDI